MSVEEILSSRKAFLVKVREQRKTYLVKDLNLLTKNIGEMRQVFCSMLSFFIIQHQIEAAYPDPEGFRELLDLFQSKTEEHLLGVTRYACSATEILSIKKLLHFCAHICAKKQMPAEEAIFLDSNLSLSVCETLLPVYQSRLTSELAGPLEGNPSANTFQQVEINTLDDYSSPI